MTDQIPQQWNVYRGWIEDDAAIFRLNLALDNIAPIANYIECVKITIPLKNPDAQGFSTDEEREIIYDIEDKLIEPLNHQKNIFVAVVTHQGYVTWYLYSQNGKELEEEIRKKENKYPDYSFQIKISKDNEWNIFFKGLYPNIYEMQAIQNRSVISNCQKYGDLVDKERLIEHWIYFDTESDMLQAIEKAKALDFSVEESEKIQPEEGEQETEDLGYRLILSKVNAPINIDEDTWDLIDIALDTHGNYDGWETPIIKE